MHDEEVHNLKYFLGEGYIKKLLLGRKILLDYEVNVDPLSSHVEYAVGLVFSSHFEFISLLDHEFVRNRLEYFVSDSAIAESIVAICSIPYKHERRKIKGTPVVTHPIAVALLVLLAGGSDTQVIAALLHDTVEDCEPQGLVTVEMINENHGAEVARIVTDLTEPEPNKQDSAKKKEEFVARKRGVVAAVTGFSTESLLVKAADLLHNSSERLADSRQYGQHIWERFNGGRAETITHFRALFVAIKDECEKKGIQLPLSADLERVISELEQDFAKDQAASVASANKSDV